MKFTTITCTSDRPVAFELCEKFLSRQTLQPAQMLVLDDGEVPVVPTIGQEHHHWPEMRGRGSMVRKIRRALAEGLVTGDAIAFIEDDDWFSPDWLRFCAEGLSRVRLFGEGRALYYTVRGRYWFAHHNMEHASLCSTAIHRDAFPWLATQLDVSECPFLDVRLWKKPPCSSHVSDPQRGAGNRRRSIGIKAMPGRTGYGGGHRGRDRSAKDDADLKYLRSLIGDDADLYAPFYDPTTPQRSEKNLFVAEPPAGRKMNAAEFHRQWMQQHPRKLP